MIVTAERLAEETRFRDGHKPRQGMVPAEDPSTGPCQPNGKPCLDGLTLSGAHALGAMIRKYRRPRRA